MFYIKKILVLLMTTLALILLVGYNLYNTVSSSVPPSKISSSYSEEEPLSTYMFRTDKLFNSHYEKHKAEFGSITQEEYLQNANALITSTSATILTKKSTDDDTLFFNKETNEFLVLSSDGFIRTYFKPDSGLDYYNRQ